MRIIYGFDNIPHIEHPVITVGSYDGVHTGHHVLISQTISRAKKRGGQSVVLTFEPHPRITLGKDDGLKLLTTLEEKALLLERCGVDFLLVIPFDITFSRLTNEQFLNNYLIGKLHAEEIIIGYNHHFGHNKSGDYNYLSSSTLEVTQVAQQRVESDKVSSTVIRGIMESGDITAATRLLGHTYIIMGQSDNNGVIRTDRYKLLPPDGIYNATINSEKGSVNIKDGLLYTEIQSQKVTIEL